MANYVDPLPDYGDLIEVADFKQAVADGFFTDYDGHGYPAKDNLMDRKICVYPSQVDQLPEDCTHIMWFNK